MEGTGNKNYDVIIVGAGPGGIFSAYELMKKRPELKLAVFESGYPLENTISQTTSVVRSTSISEERKPSI